VELTKERVKKFVDLVKNAPLRVIIDLSHIDPDSLGAAALMKKICEYLGKSVDVYFAGHVGPTQNQAIINAFHLNYLLQVELYPAKRRPDDFLILVDSPSFNDSRFGIKFDRNPDIIIDHHKRPTTIGEEDEKSWYWYEPCGACATLITKLAFALEVPFAKPDDAATLGILGIFSDTSNLTSGRTTPFDSHTVADLSDFADQKRISQISQETMDERSISILHKATDDANLKREGTTFVCSLGEIIPELEIYMVKVAETLIRTRGIATVYVWAIIGRHLKVKVRNTIDMGEIQLDQKLKQLFGQENAGAAEDSAMGAADIDLGPLAESPDRQGLVQTARAFVERKLLNHTH
jgi:nanoRNase/pAp phosphatase (c-di-AMP/oligoRNAs hydrolase)